MIKECMYAETDKISLREAAEFYFFSQMQGVTPQYDEEYATHLEKIMESRNQEIANNTKRCGYPQMMTALMGISAFKKKPVVICDIEG